MGRGELPQLSLNHALTGHSSTTTTLRNRLDWITDGQARQQSQQGNPAPRKGQLLTPVTCSIRHTIPVSLVALLTLRLPIPTTSSST